MDNRMIAERLTKYAHLLESTQEANLFRVKAYRRAAQTVLGCPNAIAEIVNEEGRDGLEALDGIGRHLAYIIERLVHTGEFRTWEERHKSTQLTPAEQLTAARNQT